MSSTAVQPGDVVAVVGAGPIGLSAIMGARLFSPSHIVAIDLADSRLDAAKLFGADVVVNNGREDALDVVRELTGGLGADVAIEAVGVPDTFELATTLIRPCGHVANIGVHGKPATLHLEQLWGRDVTITTGLVDTYSTPTLLRLATGHQLDVARFVTHHFAMDDFIAAYDTFARAADTGALKVVITTNAGRGDLLRLGHTDRAGQQRRHPPPRQRAELGVRIGEACPLGREHDVAAQHQLQPAGDAGAVHRGDHRLPDRPKGGTGIRRRERRTERDDLLDVGSRGEHGVDGSEHDHVDGVVTVDLARAARSVGASRA